MWKIWATSVIVEWLRTVHLVYVLYELGNLWTHISRKIVNNMIMLKNSHIKTYFFLVNSIKIHCFLSRHKINFHHGSNSLNLIYLLSMRTFHIPFLLRTIFKHLFWMIWIYFRWHLAALYHTGQPISRRIQCLFPRKDWKIWKNVKLPQIDPWCQLMLKSSDLVIFYHQ